MQTIKLVGKNYYLKTLLPDDVTERYVSWLNDPEVNRFLEVRFIKSTKESIQEYVKAFDNQDKFLFGIYTANNNQHIGNIALYINKPHNIAHYGYLIGEKTQWGQEAAVEAITLLLDYAFEKLGLRKVWGATYIENIGSVFNFKRLGFKQEARLRKQVIYNGKYIDTLMFGILREEWRSK